jgi:tRNA U38,U39,U40 pseudouridine synthase TruA
MSEEYSNRLIDSLTTSNLQADLFVSKENFKFNAAHFVIHEVRKRIFLSLCIHSIILEDRASHV